MRVTITLPLTGLIAHCCLPLRPVQYMVVDTKRFVAHKEMQPGLLWVLEQLPGFMQVRVVGRGYRVWVKVAISTRSWNEMGDAPSLWVAAGTAHGYGGSGVGIPAPLKCYFGFAF